MLLTVIGVHYYVMNIWNIKVKVIMYMKVLYKLEKPHSGLCKCLALT